MSQRTWTPAIADNQIINDKQGIWMVLSLLAAPYARELETPAIADNQIINDKQGIWMVLSLLATPYAPSLAAAESENKLPRTVSTP